MARSSRLEFLFLWSNAVFQNKPNNPGREQDIGKLIEELT